MGKEQLYDKIEAYLQGTLTAEERAAVEQEIKSNPEAALELQLQQVELDAMEVLLERDLRGKVSQWLDDENETPPGSGNGSPPPNPRPGRLWITIFLAVAVILAIAIWQMGRPASTNHTPSDTTPSPAQTVSPPVGPIAGQEEDIPAEKPVQPQKSTQAIRPAPDAPAAGSMLALANEFYEGLSFTNVREGITDSSDRDPLANAIAAFEKGAFKQALKLLNEVPAGSNYIIRAREMKAHALFQLKNYSESAEIFSAVAASGIPPYAERAQWNQLVCYAATLPASQAAFDTLVAELLADDGHAYHEKAKTLTARLDAGK